MNRTDYLASINVGGIGHKKVKWQTSVKPAAAHAARSLRKVTEALVMTGANYSDLAVNAEKETGSLPWGQWDVYPHIVTHKGKDYARLYVVDGTLKSLYFVDNDLVEWDTFKTYLTPSQQDATRPNGGTITVTLDNIKAVY